MLHAWTVYPALVFVLATMWSILLYVAWKVIQISRDK